MDLVLIIKHRKVKKKKRCSNTGLPETADPQKGAPLNIGQVFHFPTTEKQNQLLCHRCLNDKCRRMVECLGGTAVPRLLLHVRMPTRSAIVR
jgi:hypothetical protein